MADLDDALLAAAAPSDLEAALVYLAGCCPPGALLCGRTLPVLTLAQVYAIVQNHTNVDREVEAQRACGSLLVLQLPAALRDEPLVIQSHEVEAAMRAEAATAPDSKEQRAMELAAKLVRRCAQPRIEEADIVAFLSVEGEPEPSSVLAVAEASSAIENADFFHDAPYSTSPASAPRTTQLLSSSVPASAWITELG